MYKCCECGEIFENPARSPMEEDTGYVEQSCPCCGSDDYEEVYACPVCGEYTSEYRGTLCKQCHEELIAEPLRKTIRALVEAGMDEYSAMDEIVAFVETED